MNKTKIDWTDSSWNPVTGCLHGCEYCYARGIARRFSGCGYPLCGHDLLGYTGVILDEPYIWTDEDNEAHRIVYPADFRPTFHHYRLDDYRGRKGRMIFVCSMGDLFGEFIPDDWIKEVFAVCAAAPQHRYLFLTKNPQRYARLQKYDELRDSVPLPYGENMWYGTTATNEETIKDALALGELKGKYRTFISIEPLHGDVAATEEWRKIMYYSAWAKWIIIGAESGNRRGKIKPERKWIEQIVATCRESNTPVFMKESLRSLMGDDLIQEFPWEVKS